MLACVCRPVSSTLPHSPNMAPMAQKRTGHIVVTCEPRTTPTIPSPVKLGSKVPGRPSASELKAMALRQQQQIDSQHQLLAAKEQRLRFLKTQEIRGAAAAAENERLRRLRERVEAQESKLRRLRALRGQVDLQKTYNVTLSNDLDSIRALFSEKEKELSLAVAKVEALTRQLEELRRDRRGPLNLLATNGTQGTATGGGNATSTGTNQQTSPAARELDKLRRELMYRNQLSLQQDARLHLQREALQQRQAELRSVDQRIFELQTRLQKKKASNLQIQTQQPAYPPQPAPNPYPAQPTSKPSNSVYPSQRVIPRGNVAAVEPYIHTPQKPSGGMQQSVKKTVQHQLIQDLTNLKMNIQQTNTSINVNHLAYAESDETKLARQKFGHIKQSSKDLDADHPDFVRTEQKKQPMPYKYALTKSASSGAIPYQAAASPNGSSASSKLNESDSEKAADTDKLKLHPATHQQLTVHSIPTSTINKSVAIPVTGSDDVKPAIKPKAKHQIPSGNLVVPPRKPISSVAPTNLSLGPKVVAHSAKVNMVTPNINTTPIVSSVEDKARPALPPKPNKNPNDQETSSSVPTVVSVINKPPISEPIESPTSFPPNSDHLPIKARPLTIKKQPLSEQPRLRTQNPSVKPMPYISRRIEMPPAFLFPEIEKVHLKDKSSPDQNESGQPSPTDGSTSTSSSTSCTSSNTSEDVDKSGHSEENNRSGPGDVLRRVRSSQTHENGKTKLARRVSFDPLALLLDASLEGELELVKKTTMQVPNPSAANDEGITALHNAICAGHFEIVKFLVEYGCDVNAQDSDGWTPLHCAASCNNLQMVKFLVESGACLFAATLSDQETPAEKCEEDEEGFDGCSEYLYSIQEKLGILNSGEVYAVFSYDCQQSDELSFDVNDRLVILRKGDDSEREWWWAKSDQGQEGYVPRNLLGLYPRIPMQQQLSD